MSKYKFFELAGVDATGKTTAADNLMAKINGKPYACPPEAISSVRRAVGRYSPTASYHFYLSGNHIAAEEIGDLLQDNHVVSDRYLLSTLTHHSVSMGIDLPIPDDLPLMPDFVIYTHAPMDVIVTRLEERAKETGEPLKEHENPEFLAGMIEKYEGYIKQLDSVVSVDTSLGTPEDTLNFICDGISKIGFNFTNF
ncbi:MAG: hypothetical protein V3V78_03855 [Candidatus Woesearchaeota archaeon]